MGGLGFRHLHDFNVALLGKQAWRLLTNADSLVARIYKARYYPQSNFLSTKIGGSPSFVWRSVLEAQNMIRTGAACRMGSGVSNDPWLPDSHQPFITTSNSELERKTVSSMVAHG